MSDGGDGTKMPLTQAPTFSFLNTVARIVLDDLHGQVSDSKTGWPDEVDNTSSERFAIVPMT